MRPAIESAARFASWAMIGASVVMACTQQQLRTNLARADVVCAGLLKDKPSADIAKACNLEQPLAEAIRDGVAAYEDVKSGTSAGPDVSAAVVAAQSAGADLFGAPKDAGGQ